MNRNRKAREELKQTGAQMKYERETQKTKYLVEIRCMERAIAFKKAQISSGQIIERIEGFEGNIKPTFMLENEVDLNQMQISQRKLMIAEIEKLEKEDAENTTT